MLTNLVRRGWIWCVLAMSGAAWGQASGPAVGKAYAGYTLVAPMQSPVVTLVDLEGKVVHTWQTGFSPGASTYLLDNGNLLRTANSGAGLGGGRGGRQAEVAGIRRARRAGDESRKSPGMERWSGILNT